MNTCSGDDSTKPLSGYVQPHCAALLSGHPRPKERNGVTMLVITNISNNKNSDRNNDQNDSTSTDHAEDLSGAN